MNTEAIDSAFKKLMGEEAVYKKIGITALNMVQLRHRLKTGVGISLKRKMSLLQKAGWKQDDKVFSRADLVDVVNSALRSSASAKALGPEYLVDKFLNKK